MWCGSFGWFATASQYNTSRKSIVWTVRRRQQQQRLTQSDFTDCDFSLLNFSLFHALDVHTLDSVWWCGGYSSRFNDTSQLIIHTSQLLNEYDAAMSSPINIIAHKVLLFCQTAIRASNEKRTHIFGNDRTLGTREQTSERMNATEGSSTSVQEKRKRANTIKTEKRRGTQEKNRAANDT